MTFIRHLILILFILIKLSSAQQLLLLFLDGFRWDYISDTNLRGFSEMKKNGAYISKVRPVFPADCHPNIYSIFTGLYPQHHGVVGNKVYSVTAKKEFNHNSEFHRRDVHKWVNAEPLWVTSKKQGKHSFLYHLPICESSFAPLSPTFCVPFHAKYMNIPSFNSSIREALRSLTGGVASMAVVYNDQLDRVTHKYGPQSATLKDNLLPAIDLLIQSLLMEIRGSDIHLVILSDHGMAPIALDRQIYLERLIMRSAVERVINQGGYASIWPREGSFDEVFYRLKMATEDSTKQFQLYSHDTMPTEWNAFSESLSPPILLVAEPGFFIVSKELSFPSGKDFYNSGWHGYAPENDDMASPFLAMGPRMTPGISLDKAHVTDVYQLLAHLAGIEPQLHNGSSSFLSFLLRQPSVSSIDVPEDAGSSSLTSSSCRFTTQSIHFSLVLVALVQWKVVVAFLFQ